MQATTISVVLGLAIVSGAAPAFEAAWSPERPLRTQTINGEDGDKFTCTIYPDLIVREPDSESASPNPATLVHPAKGLPACPVHSPAGTKLDTMGFNYVGRKGAFLIFEESDPNGPIGFSIIEAQSGRSVINDVSSNGLSASLHNLAVTTDSISISFRRAQSVDCSLLDRPAACWQTITRKKDNDIPLNIAALGPPTVVCAKSYALNHTERKDPSILSYEMKEMWSRKGGRTEQATGPLGCNFMP